MRFFIVVSLAMSALAANATSLTIDFEEFSEGTSEILVSSQGFDLTQNVAGIGIIGSGLNLANNAFFFCGDCENPTGFQMRRTEGESFSLNSFDAAIINGGLPYALSVTGYYANGGTIVLSQDLTVGPLETISLGSGWAGLDRVTFSVDTIAGNTFNVAAFDNIVASVVPIPAAVWLFGSALAGLGWIRRRSQG